MNKQLKAQIAFWFWCACGAVAAACALSLVSILPSTPAPTSQGPDPFVSRVGHRTPTPGPTTRPQRRLYVPITDLIIQQNPTCWDGVPGDVCEP